MLTLPSSACTFCTIAAANHPTSRLNHFATVFSFIPENKLSNRHRIFMPKTHGVAALEQTLSAAVGYANSHGESYNLFLGSALFTGSEAELALDTSDHQHIHYVPRNPGDQIALPWAGGRTGILDVFSTPLLKVQAASAPLLQKVS